MSTTVMAACWPLQLPPTPKAVLISLADNANDHGVCWPSISTICARTCFGKTAVIEAIQWLESHALLAPERSNGRHTKYQIIPTLDLFKNAEPIRKANRTAIRTGSGDTPVRLPEQPVRQADTNRKKSLKAKSNNTGKRGSRLPDEWVPSNELKAWAKQDFPAVDIAKTVVEFVDYWIAVPGARGLKLDWAATFRNRIRDIAARRPIGLTLPKSTVPASFEPFKPKRKARGDPNAPPPAAFSILAATLGIHQPP